ncbi:hypothetical protein IWQ60_003357 [Tieghemiomyces parasiticus]|uniref:Mitochondrial carrier n=1 Tax=Tieghemiomyces parasiticus TaxID=78921 RepID=A0A9W8AFQ8_9FUNG|nr:hypothetical protein IWQ60_003357 [Tieghemiomyces parasiticus]
MASPPGDGPTASAQRPYSVPAIDPSLSAGDLTRLNPLSPHFQTTGGGLGADDYTQALLQNGGYGDDLGYYTEETAPRNLVYFSGLRFLTVAMSNPFEVGQTLLQVQHVPDGCATGAGADDSGGEADRSDSGRSRIPGPEDPGYYEYLRSNPPSSTGGVHPNVGGSGRRHRTPRTDHTGYFTPTVSQLDDDGTRADYNLGILETGVLGTMRTLYSHPGEGIFSLLKGQFTGWVYEMAQLLTQPTLEGYLNEIFNLYDDTIPLVHLEHIWPNLGTLVGSHVITGVLLSPLELMRTRLMIQPALPARRKYAGLLSGLRTVLREEGGLRALYLSGVHLIPTVIFHTMRPLFEHTTALVITRALGVSAEDAPFTYVLAELAFRTLELVVMLPIDTIRKRLQAQPRYTKDFTISVTSSADTSASPSRSRATAPPALLTAASSSVAAGFTSSSSFRPFVTSVNLSPVPYTGMLNCAYRIITEEGASPRRLREARERRRQEGGGDEYQRYRSAEGSVATRQRRGRSTANDGPRVTWGLRGLYQGFGLHFASHTSLFAVGLLGGIRVEEDW